MNTLELKKISLIQKYIVENFSAGDWANLGVLTASSELINNHDRLLRSLAFGDDDYEQNASFVILKICELSNEYIDLIIDNYDIDLWLKQKDYNKYEKLFGSGIAVNPKFWKPGYLRVFISHLAKSKTKAADLKRFLENYGFSCFVAHDDIETTKEWVVEIESALSTMDLLIAIIEPDFEKSKWTDQEIGFALGRHIDVISLLVNCDPHGFLSKYQGIKCKDRYAKDISMDIFKVILKKPKFRNQIMSSLYLSFKNLRTTTKIEIINLVEETATFQPLEMKALLENASLSEQEKIKIEKLIIKYNAFVEKKGKIKLDEEVPF